MTASTDRLDRIEALVEKNSQAIEKNSQAIEKLTEETKELNIRFAAYQQASQWVVNLAFGLLATATITTIVTAVLR
jgi:chromosome segregation ATPase